MFVICVTVKLLRVCVSIHEIYTNLIELPVTFGLDLEEKRSDN